MLTTKALENIKKEVDVLQKQRQELFTKEIVGSRAYKRMFPRISSAMNDSENNLVHCVESFERLCAEVICHNYEFNSSKCVNDFIDELKNLLSKMKSLINEIDWEK